MAHGVKQVLFLQCSAQKWQVYHNLFYQLLLSFIIKSSQVLMMTSLSIRSQVFPLDALPIILRSVMSVNSDSCLKMCSI